MRSILRDRMSASAVVLLVACLLLIQGLLTGTAQGAMSASAADPFHVICSSTADGSFDAVGHGNVPAKKAPECPCGTLCRLASTAMPAILGAQAGPLYLAIETAIGTVIRRDAFLSPVLRGRIAEPRAPPITA